MKTIIRWTAILMLAWLPTSHAALTFSLNNLNNSVTGNFLTGFISAANFWSTTFNDPVTININIAMATLGSGILGQANVSTGSAAYAVVRQALNNDASSSFDSTAVASLQTGTHFNFMLNRTADNPHGSGSPIPYLDNNSSLNNARVSMTTANAKALGLLAGNNPAADAAITFNTAFAWDFDASNGISPATFDFVAVAIHEIGHALGFISNVDILDGNSPPHNGPFTGDQFADRGAAVSILDLFRYSADSCLDGNGKVPDWSADNRAKYFSIDRCASLPVQFATGINFGDGRQASHWKDGQNIGLLDPTLAPGIPGEVSFWDVLALDVIGWNVAQSGTVPLPPTLALMALGWLLLLARKNQLLR